VDGKFFGTKHHRSFLKSIFNVDGDFSWNNRFYFLLLDVKNTFFIKRREDYKAQHWEKPQSVKKQRRKEENNLYKEGSPTPPPHEGLPLGLPKTTDTYDQGSRNRWEPDRFGWFPVEPVRPDT
jgi:hypothetical protein